jgi:ABC-type polysaccharide/polyol phosphate transport system ATPase subunit
MFSSGSVTTSEAFCEDSAVSDVAIRVRNLVKDFEVYAKPLDLAIEVLTRRQRHRTFRALDDVSFDVGKGQVLGIIGSNGAGKSTLLKIITGVLDATSGSVEVAGRVTAILELGLGFNPDHSGRDNIRLSGLLYGMDSKEIDRKLDAIIDFSGLHPFIDQPVKHYSSGMQARLAFSIATAVDPEILIIDEALAAGDAMFVQKCLRRIRELCSGGRTVLLVSHGTGLLAQLCREVMWLDLGRLKMRGPALTVVQAYDLAAHQGADIASWIEPVEDTSLAGPSPVPAAPQEPTSHDGERTAPASEAVPGSTPAPPLDCEAEEGLGRAAAQAAEAERKAAMEAEEQRELLAAAVATFKPPTQVEEDLAEAAPSAGTGKNVFRRGPIFIDSVTLLDHHNRPSVQLTTTLPFTLRIDYHCKGEPPADTLGIAIAVNRLGNLESVMQWFTQMIRPDETWQNYDSAPFRITPMRAGRIELNFPYTPMRQDEYILSVGLLPNQPGNWEFYEYRHLFYPFRVTDGGLGVGAPIYFEPRLVHLPGTGTPARMEEEVDA